MELWSILGDIVALLAACLVVGGVFSRFGQSPLVGYLLVGMMLGGPGSFHVIHSEHEIEAIAELGVALLLFSLGLEFSFQRLKSLGARPLAAGALQVVITMLLGALVAYLVGAGVKAALAFGIMISLSSTAVVLRTLMERAELETPHGRNSLAVLLVQDIAVVPLALLMTLLGEGGTFEEVSKRVAILLSMTLALLLTLFVLNKIAVRALASLTLLRNRELTVLFAIVMGLGSAWAAHSAGVSPALGAFVAGMLLGSSAFATQIRADVSSLRVVLLTLFFGAAGMVADPIWIMENLGVVLLVTLLLTIGKMTIIWFLFQAFGKSLRESAATGLCLAQIGEFAFVLGTIGVANGVVSTDLYALVVSVTILSFILSAILVPSAPKFGNVLARLLRSSSPELTENSTPLPAPDVVIIGFGPAGRIAAQSFVDSGREVAVIDLNIDGIRRARDLGFRAQLGDGTQNEVLEHADIAHANVVVITIPHHESAMAILEHVREMAPHAHIVVRSRYQIHTERFSQAGAHSVIGDEEQVGESLAAYLKEWLAAST